MKTNAKHMSMSGKIVKMILCMALHVIGILLWITAFCTWPEDVLVGTYVVLGLLYLLSFFLNVIDYPK